jgi:hypothetical protein
VDRSRFGAQGTCFVKSGTALTGDPVAPVYPLLGARWVYCNRRPAELCAQGRDAYAPQTDMEVWRKRGMYEAAAGLCLLIDCHSVPDWLMAYPATVQAKPKPNPTHDLQAYPPRDFDAYATIVGRVAAEEAARRRALFPDQSHNYYQIHWEPDWNWRGSDAQFIRMYQAAHAAIHTNDPDGLLLGPNYGVLKTGNQHLKRLLPQGLGSCLDGLLTHTYYLPLEQSPEAGGLATDLRDLMALARQYLPPGAPVVNTEWGLNYFGRPPTTDPGALVREAAWFLRGHLIALGEGADTTFFFYAADADADKGGGLLYNLTVPNPRYGATHVAPKPVFMACAVATRLLEGTRSLGAIANLGTNTLGYAFDRNGERVLALWSTDEQTREIALPSAGKTATLLDPMGNARELQSRDGVLRATTGALPVWLRNVAASALQPSSKSDR